MRLINHIRRAARNGVASSSSSASSGRQEVVVTAVKAALAPSQLAASAPLWSDDDLLIPVLEGDGLIMTVLGDDDDDDITGALGSNSADQRTSGAVRGAGDDGDDEGIAAGIHSSSSSSKAGAQTSSTSASASAGSARIAALTAELQSARELIARLTSAHASGGDDSDSDDGDNEDERARGFGRNNSSSSSSTKPTASGKGTMGTKTGGSGGGQDNDTYYFDSYASAGIHSEMIKDRVRTEAYRDAILRNPAWFGGKTVADVGCGTGILSMFTAQSQVAGESSTAGNGSSDVISTTIKRGHVIALDASGIVEDARAIIGANGFGDRISVVRGKVEDLDLASVVKGIASRSSSCTSSSSSASEPASRVDPDGRCLDVIVSEWMGYALLYECMLDSVLVVRDRYLRSGGRMLPSRASIHVAAVSDAALWHAKAGFWRDVYGLNLSHMGRHVFSEPYVEVLPAGCIASTTADIRHFDLLHMDRREQDILGQGFEVTLTPSGADSAVDVIHGLALWFDIGFGGETYRGPNDSSSASASTAAAVVEEVGDEPPLLETDDAAASSSSSSSSGGKAACSASPPDLPPADVVFSTSPAHTPTHWQQTLFLFDPPLPLDRPSAPPSDASAAPVTLRGQLTMVRDAANPREYRFQVELVTPSGRKHAQSYHMR